MTTMFATQWIGTKRLHRMFLHIERLSRSDRQSHSLERVCQAQKWSNLPVVEMGTLMCSLQAIEGIDHLDSGNLYTSRRKAESSF